MSNSIGFSNFRQFVKFPTINLGDITILVGGNNAGKSTLVKAMLLMRDFLQSRIQRAEMIGNIFKTVTPQFSFDTEHVNVGEFYRAFCRQSPEKENEISFTMNIDKFCFVVKIRGERKPGIIPDVSLIAVSDEKSKHSFTFNFAKSQMTASFALQENGTKVNIENILKEREELNAQLKKTKDLDEISKIKLDIEQLNKLVHVQDYNRLIAESMDESVTIDMSYFIGDSVGELLIPELIKGFVHYADIGILGDKRTKIYREEEGKKSFLRGKISLINTFAKEVEDAINKQVIEYIYAHSVAQTTFYANCAASSDYNKRTIHEFYNARISVGDKEFSMLEEWLKKFNIGNSLKVLSYTGDTYRIVIYDDENQIITDPSNEEYPGGIDLADKGMGSIQLVVLMLRLFTLARQYRGRQLTVLLEEPEQNLHPEVQSLLSDLLNAITEEFGIRFIVETHSEYLVRHFQVLAARKLFENGASADEINRHIKVYYFSKERGVVDMLFMDNAKFQDFFDEGFFDQASREALTISRLERINKR